MKRFALIALLALSACTSGPPRERYPGVKLRPVAQPSAVIAAEIGFAQLAQEKGQWTAFRATATPDAEMFVPQRVNAQGWLKGRADPPVAVKWQPHAVWSSCDGSVAVTRGAWQRPNGVGYFTTVWQRQKDGGYKWVLDMGEPIPTALPTPEMIAAKVATCSKATETAVPGVMDRDGAVLDDRVGTSVDGTLVWNSSVRPDGKSSLTVWLWNGKELDTVLDTGVAPHGH